MKKRLIVIGAGGMARCVLDLLDELNAHFGLAGSPGGYEVLGVVADLAPTSGLIEERGVKYLGPVENLVNMERDVHYVIGVGDPQARRQLDEYAQAHGRESATIIHPNVHMGHDVQVAPGSVIASHVSLENNIRLGRHVHVNQNSTVGHDAVLGDWTTISPLVAVSGNVVTGETAFVGTGASIRQCTHLGAGSVVGMGAAVLDDVPDGVTVVGVPARPIRQAAS